MPVRIPDRIGALIAAVEAGRDLTAKDVERVALLQVLDLAKLGEDFVRDTIAADERLTKALEDHQP